MNHEENIKRYQAACHAMQTGVAMEHELGSQDGTKKHLRVGVNSAMVQHSALVKILIAKGLFTAEEYMEKLADAMEEEVAHFERRLSEAMGGKSITLG